VVTIGTKAAPAAVVKTGETVNTTRIVIASILIGAAAGILFIRRRETEIEKEEN
jgi:LPXTG-motif cell wall-anchored protein